MSVIIPINTTANTSLKICELDNLEIHLKMISMQKEQNNANKTIATIFILTSKIIIGGSR